MIVLLLTLIVIYRRLNQDNWTPTTAEKWLVKIPFSIYLGWITVATIANATSLLDYIGWGGFGIAPEVWAVIMLVVATGVGLLFSLRERDVAYVLVLIWAIVGIAVSQWDTPVVAWTALAMSACWGYRLLAGGFSIAHGPTTRRQSPLLPEAFTRTSTADLADAADPAD